VFKVQIFKFLVTGNLGKPGFYCRSRGDR